MLQDHGEDITACILRFFQSDDLIKLSLCSSGLHRDTVNCSLNIFSLLFGIDLADPHTIFPNSKGDLFRLICRAEDESNLTHPFLFACASGYNSFVEHVLQRIHIAKKVSLLESCFSKGQTPLILACRNNRVHIARTLLKNGAFADFVDSFGRTALLYASIGCFPETVKELLEAGSACRNISAALYEAVRATGVSSEARIACVKLLGLKHLEQLNSYSERIHADRFSESLQRVSRNECDQYVRILNACIAGSVGANLLQELTDPLKKFELARSLIREFSISADNPLIFAAACNYTDGIEALLDSGLCHVSDQALKSRKSALFVAAENGNYSFVETLLKANASVSSQTSSGRNCLHIAVERDQVGITELLCEYATAQDIQHVHVGGVSPFHLAENRGRVKMVLAMLRCYKRTVTQSTVSARMTDLCLKYNKLIKHEGPRYSAGKRKKIHVVNSR